MRLLKKFILPMNHELPKKSFEWIISEDKVLLEDEIQKLRKFCQRRKARGIRNKKLQPVRDWFMVELGLLTGLRVEEMTELKIKDILIDSQHASVIVRHGKGGKKRTVWINDEFKLICRKFLTLRENFNLSNEIEQFLLTSTKGKQLSKRALQKRFKLCVKEANLPSHYSIHCLRHTYGTFLLKVSRNLKLVKEQLGHSTVKTTEVYIGLIEQDVKTALKRLYKD